MRNPFMNPENLFLYHDLPVLAFTISAVVQLCNKKRLYFWFNLFIILAIECTFYMVYTSKSIEIMLQHFVFFPSFIGGILSVIFIIINELKKGKNI